MYIRKAQKADTAAILNLYTKARSFMRLNGNTAQWSEAYPGEASLKADMERGCSYVCCSFPGSGICASFYFAREREPSYNSIQGSWLNDEPYGLVHRLVCGEFGKGIGSFCLEYCVSRIPNIRIDTHKDNLPMRALLKKTGFAYCGIVLLNDGSERLAFQRSAFPKSTFHKSAYILNSSPK